MNKKKPVIAVTMGDPAGIGPEIMIKAINNARVKANIIPLLIGDPAILRQTADRLGYGFNPVVISDAKTTFSEDRYYLLDTESIGNVEPGKPAYECGIAMAGYIKTAVRLALNHEVGAITTCPINKEVMNSAGYQYAGHTEFLAELTGAKEFAMMMVGGGLRVTLLTIHTALSNVPSLVTKDRLIKTIELTHASMVRFWGKKTPVIAVAALNPHAGEAGMFGDEEITTIIPAIKHCNEIGIDVRGPIPADTLFYRALKSEFDAEIVMYHDQGLIPLKTVAFDTGVNVTLGLPIIRTSVDHGTAYDLAGTGKASENSLIEALLLAADFVRESKKY